MRSFSPYFENVPKYGDLYLEQIIVDYDYPLFFVVKDIKGGRFICSCYSIEPSQRWVITPVSIDKLCGILQNKVLLDAPYKNKKTDNIIAIWDLETQCTEYTQIDSSNTPSNILPAPNEYLDADVGEWDDYIARLKRENVLHIILRNRIASTKKPAFKKSLVDYSDSMVDSIKVYNSAYLIPVEPVVINVIHYSISNGNNLRGSKKYGKILFDKDGGRIVLDSSDTQNRWNNVVPSQLYASVSSEE